MAVSVTEASRQYQLALEHERTVRHVLAGVLSAQDELDAARRETALARWQLRVAIVDAQLAALAAA